MNWLYRRPRIDIRRHSARAAIVCVVLAGHAIFFALLCWPGRTPVAKEVGVAGDVLFASLVTAHHAPMPSRTNQARPDPVKSVKTLPPTPHNERLPVVATIETAETAFLVPNPTPPLLPPDEAVQAPQLSEMDAIAVAQFEPAFAQGEPNKPCDLTQSLTLAFAHSSAVQQGLAELPPSEKSVANAVMLWDGRWSDETMSGGSGMLRALLVKAISSARADCLTRLNRGPVLFMLPDRQTTVVLAIGSGEWRWGDLISLPPTKNIFF